MTASRARRTRTIDGSNLEGESRAIRRDTTKQVDAAVATVVQVPLASMMLWSAPGANNTIPTKWLRAMGQDVSRRDYPELFDIFGVTLGTGDGITTFTLPDPTDPDANHYWIIYAGRAAP